MVYKAEVIFFFFSYYDVGRRSRRCGFCYIGFVQYNTRTLFFFSSSTTPFSRSDTWVPMREGTLFIDASPCGGRLFYWGLIIHVM